MDEKPALNDRLYDDWRLQPDSSDAVVEFSKPDAEFRTAPPIRPTETYIEKRYSNEVNRKPIPHPDDVRSDQDVRRAFRKGWVIPCPSDVLVEEKRDEYGNRTVETKMEHVRVSVEKVFDDATEPTHYRLLRIGTRWRVEVDPPRPLALFHPVFAGHEQFTTLPAVLHPEHHAGEIEVVVRVNDVPEWLNYGDPLAQVVPLPDETTDGFAATVDRTGDG